MSRVKQIAGNDYLYRQVLKANIPYLLSLNLIYWLPSEYYVEKRTYQSLKRAWIGFKIAKQKGNHDKMKYYAEGIQKFQRLLRLPVSNFSDILKENDLDSQTKLIESGATNNEL